jgi:hypothetical protein
VGGCSQLPLQVGDVVGRWSQRRPRGARERANASGKEWAGRKGRDKHRALEVVVHRAHKKLFWPPSPHANQYSFHLHDGPLRGERLIILFRAPSRLVKRRWARLGQNVHAHAGPEGVPAKGDIYASMVRSVRDCGALRGAAQCLTSPLSLLRASPAPALPLCNGAQYQVRRHALRDDAAARERDGVSQHHLRLPSAQDGVLQRAQGLC